MTTVRKMGVALLVVAGLYSGLGRAEAGALTLDGFAYADSKKAAQSWRAIDRSPPVRVVAPGAGLTFPCPFHRDLDRAYWDRDVTLDLSRYSSLEVQLSCDQPAALRKLSLYFKSGDGWFVASQPLNGTGRQHLVFQLSDFSTEGKPAGWQRIERIRLSPWKGSPLAAQLTLHALTARKDGVAVVKATLSTQDAGERAMSARLAERVSRWLTAEGVAHAVIDEQEAVRTGLRDARLVILPLNPTPPAALLAALKAFFERGGHALVCFSASADLARLMRVELGAYTPRPEPGRWEAMAFDAASDWNLPERVYQSSWNIRPVRPLDDGGRVIARWVTSAGRVLDDPAWVATERGAWMSHVLLEDDTFAKQEMLLGLLAHYEPSLWHEAARHSIGTAGRIDNFSGLAQALDGLGALSAGLPGETRVASLLERARRLDRDMRTRLQEGNYPGVVTSSRELHHVLTEAYSLCQSPRAGELRALWDHDGTGWYVGDWSRTTRTLADNGFNAVFANFQWAGLAHYPSEVLPVSDTCRLYGDQVAAALAAGRRHGVQVHAWKICWNVEQAPDSFVARMKQGHRLLHGAKGQTLNWLDPARADNVELEVQALCELVRKYDVDGIHLDYVRYPPGLPPGTVKASAITHFVRRVHDEVKAIRPDVQISAAVWGAYPSCVASVGQDWALWLKEGLVDFVCPMNYTEDRYQFNALLEKQLTLPRARGRLVAGIGVTSAESQLQPDQVIDQIRTLRALNGVAGFALFDLSHPVLDETLPALRRGITRPE